MGVFGNSFTKLYLASFQTNYFDCCSHQTRSSRAKIRANRIAPFLLLLLAARFAIARGTCFSVASSFSGAHRKQRATPRSEKSANSS